MAKTITASVGRMGGTNRPADVRTVQHLLNKVPPDSGGPVLPLIPDAFCGPKTIHAIQTFQLHHFGWSGADGKVNPDGETLKKLNEFDSTTEVPPTTERTAISFGIRQVEMDHITASDGLFKFKFFQIVDAANQVTAFYTQRLDSKLSTIRIVFGSLRIVRRAPFSNFVTPFATSVISFAGDCFKQSVTVSPSKETIRLFLPKVGDKPANLNLIFEGLPTGSNPGSFGSNASPLALAEPTARPIGRRL